MNPVPKIFISHITEEAVLAKIIKEEISNAFLGLVDIFVSSDVQSISIGSKWLDQIDQALRDAQIMLVLCSKDSVRRPWINFESGAGWVKGIPVVPVCHTGLDPVDLPIPLNMLEGINATCPEHLEKLVCLVASQMGARIPQLDYEGIVNQITSFEHHYGVIQVARSHILELIKLEPQLRELFCLGNGARDASGFLPDLLIDKLKPHLDKLQEIRLVNYSLGINKIAFGPNGGNQVELKININETYEDIVDEIFN